MGGAKYEYTTALSDAPPVVERKEPAAPVQVGVVVLTWLVAIAAGIGALFGGLIGNTGRAALWGAATGGLLMLIFCLIRLIPVIEVMFGVDINGDKRIGDRPTAEPPQVHEYHLTTDSGGSWFDLPDGVDHRHFVIMCKKFLADRTAEADHRGMTEELGLVRGMLMDHGLAEWKAKNGEAKNAGWQLTRPGRAFCRRVAEDE